jgi:hypothetical protein
MPTPVDFGDYLVFVDESGDHSLTSIDSIYSVFVLAFIMIKKSDYIDKVTPALQYFKMRYWGHDEVVLHEHEIRKPRDAYSFLRKGQLRGQFMEELSGLMEALPATVIAVVIDKPAFVHRHSPEARAYDHAMEAGIDAVFQYLTEVGQAERKTAVVVECRGRREDKELELAFRRICDTGSTHDRPLPLELVMIPKTSNSPGLQLADLFARPIGIHHLRPQQPNRAFEIIHPKLHRSPKGELQGWGMIPIP